MVDTTFRVNANIEEAMGASLSLAYKRATMANCKAFDRALEDAMIASLGSNINDEKHVAVLEALRVAIVNLRQSRRGNARGKAKQVLRDKIDLHLAGAVGRQHNPNYDKMAAASRATFEKAVAHAQTLVHRKRATMAQLQAALDALKAAGAALTDDEKETKTPS